MCTKRDIILFLAGAETFHTISHAFLGASKVLPMTIFSMTITPRFNMWMTIINAIISCALIYWAIQLGSEKR